MARPSVLFVYYTYTQQTLKVAEAMAGVLRRRGCDVTLASIEFTDPRYVARFRQFPMPHPFLEVLGMIPAELRRRPAKIGIPGVVTEREYDLVCIGSPTWWLTTDVPIRSFLESDAASRVLGGKPFAAAVPCRRYWRHNLKTVRRLGMERGGLHLGGSLPGQIQRCHAQSSQQDATISGTRCGVSPLYSLIRVRLQQSGEQAALLSTALEPAGAPGGSARMPARPPQNQARA
jgi:hypothetical protein